jgi:methyl-accepting chemotaxis protein
VRNGIFLEDVLKIGIKLTIVMIVLSLIGVGVVGVTLLFQAQKNITSLAHDRAVATAQEYAGEIQNFFATYWFTAQTMAQVMEDYENIDAPLRRPLFNSMIESVIERNSDISGIWCIWEPDALEGDDQLYLGTPGTNDAGRFAPYWYREENVIETYPLDDFDLPTQDDYYTLSKVDGKGTLLDLSIDEVGGEMILNMSITASIYKGSTLLGIIGLDFTADNIQELAQSHKPFGTGKSAIYSNTGTIASHFNPGYVGMPMQETEQDMAGPYFNKMIEAVLSGTPFYFTNYFPEENMDMDIIIAPITVAESNVTWSYAVVIPRKTIMAPVYTMISIIIIMSIAIFAFIITAAVILGRSLTKPLILITNSLKDISEGEGDLTRSLEIKTKDEIGSLAQHFNVTIEKIRILIKTIQNKVTALTNTGFELSVNMNKTADAVNQISSKFENIKSLIAIQEEKADKADKAVGEINTSINNLYTLVGEQAANVDTSSSAVEEMTANIRSVTNTLLSNSTNFLDLSNAAETGKSGLQAVAEKIAAITKLSEGLLEINAVMNNIASQTNLLSMNAAIEAAHAGESGRGFAVVADEIRKLAESSSQQSKTTSVMLKEIKDSIENITKSSDEVITHFEAIDTKVKIVTEHNQNIQHAMEEQEAGGTQILEAVSRLKDVTLSVKEGTEKMSEAGRRVIKETGEFISVSDQVVDGMNDIISVTMSQIKSAVENVNEMSRENNANFEDLKNETAKFKVSTGNESNKILVIDDDEIHLAIVKQMLENDYEITALTSGEAALKLFYQGYSPNFILLDIMMPGMDGWDTLGRIKAISELHNVPIVFVSASNDPADISRAKKTGAVDFIGKPVERELLLKKIKGYIKAE